MGTIPLILTINSLLSFFRSGVDCLDCVKVCLFDRRKLSDLKFAIFCFRFFPLPADGLQIRPHLNHVEIVGCHVVRLTVTRSCSEFPNNCFLFKLIIFENMFNVLAYIGFARGVKLAELLLGEPSGFA